MDILLLKKVLNYFIVVFVILNISLSCDELPEEVNISDLPDYYFENNYLDERVKAINNAIEECSDGCETFFWITDIHWEPNLNTRISPILIKYISTKTGIDKVLNGGDTGSSQVICENAISQLRKAIGSNKVYTVTGNHEMDDASRYESPYERVSDELRGHNADIVYGDNNRTFFYFDNRESKTRYIGLSSYGLFQGNNYITGFTEEQLEWLKTIALKVDENWTLLLFSHSLYYVDVVTDKLRVGQLEASDFIKVIDSYKGNGTIASVLMGHAHRDRIHIGPTGVPYIISASDGYATHQGDINVTRVPGTISEQHFEVVVINKGKREVKLFSIGAPARDGFDDNQGNEVDLRIVNY